MIIRRKVNADFTIVPNAVFRDNRLPYEVIGLLVYLLSKPQDWTVQLTQLASNGGIGIEKARKLVNELITAGYMKRSRTRNAKTKVFEHTEYVVYDRPEHVGDEPQIENRCLGQRESSNEPHAEKPCKGKPRTENPTLLNIEVTKSLSNEREDSISDKPGGKPSLSAQIWKEALPLVRLQNPNEKQARTLVGKWQKRTHSAEAKDKLLTIVRAARRAGSPRPIDYISKALNQTFPPPPSPKTFDRKKWETVVQAATERREWSSDWGPPPGKGGCVAPPDLVTGALLTALQRRTGG